MFKVEQGYSHNCKDEWRKFTNSRLSDDHKLTVWSPSRHTSSGLGCYIT